MKSVRCGLAGERRVRLGLFGGAGCPRPLHAPGHRMPPECPRLGEWCRADAQAAGGAGGGGRGRPRRDVPPRPGSLLVAGAPRHTQRPGAAGVTAARRGAGHLPSPVQLEKGDGPGASHTCRLPERGTGGAEARVHGGETRVRGERRAGRQGGTVLVVSSLPRLHLPLSRPPGQADVATWPVPLA